MSTVPAQRKKTNLGAGLNVAKQNIEDHPAGPPRHGELSQAERAFTLASTFLSGVLAISASQFLGAPLKLIDPQFYDGYMAYTKESFAVLVTCLTQWWAPTVVRVSGDSSMLGQMKRMPDGSLQCNFADRMVLMANHQLYTDWLYLWWIAYTNNMHGFVYIILKESLKSVPIIGWGCQFYNFIFLSRKWEEDESRFKQHLSKLNNPSNPMWLIIFPEGTNLSETTRAKSKKWAEKNGLQDMKHQLLPRSTGLRFCLQELRQTTEWLYDCTIAYEGVPPGQYGQDIFTLRSSFFEGRPPKSVNMHWRRFRIDDIPTSQVAFDVWLRNRWREKDYMLEYFNRNTRFPAEDFWKDHLNMNDVKSESSRTLRTVPRPAVQIETEVKSGSWNEFVKIFAPITSVMGALTIAYGASPADLPIPGGAEYFQQMLQTLMQGGDLKGLPSPDELEKMIEGAARMGAQKEAKPQDREKVQKLTQENLAKLVKETAIKNGMVLPGGMRRASTALPALTAPPQKTTGAKTVKQAPRAKSAINAPVTPKKPVASAKKPLTTAKKPITRSEPPKEMMEVMTGSGVRIKVPKPQVEDVKKTGTITLQNGLTIKIGKEEMEEAQKKKGQTIMTASGIPIKISPSGAMTVEQKPEEKPKPKYKFTPTPKADAGAAKKAASAKSNTPAASKPSVAANKSKPATQPRSSAAVPAKKPNGPQVVTKKDFTPVSGSVPKRPAAKPVKLGTANAGAKKVGAGN